MLRLSFQRPLCGFVGVAQCRGLCLMLRQSQRTVSLNKHHLCSYIIRGVFNGLFNCVL